MKTNNQLSPELKKVRDLFYGTARQNGWIRTGTNNYLDRGVEGFFLRNKHLPLEQLEEKLFDSKYVMPKAKPDSPEIIALRDNFYQQARDNGWHLDGEKNRTSWAVVTFFRTIKDLPLPDLERRLLKSKYLKPKPPEPSIELTSLRDSFYAAARQAGWVQKENRNKVSSCPIHLYGNNKHLPLDQLRKVLFNSKYVQPNPEIYKDPHVLWEVLEPHRDKIQEVMAQCCGFVLGVRSQEPMPKAELLRSVRDQLCTFIDNRAAVNAFVMAIPDYSVQYWS